MYLKSRDSDAFDEATGGGTQASNYIYTQIVLVLGGGDTVTSRPCPSPSPSLVPTEIGRGGWGGANAPAPSSGNCQSFFSRVAFVRQRYSHNIDML